MGDPFILIKEKNYILNDKKMIIQYNKKLDENILDCIKSIKGEGQIDNLYIEYTGLL